MCYDVYYFYAKNNDSGLPVFKKKPELSQPLEAIYVCNRMCVLYVFDISLSEKDCHNYHRNILLRDRITRTTAPFSLSSTLPTAIDFNLCCSAYRKFGLIQQCCMRASVNLDSTEPNEPICLRCALDLMKKLYRKADGVGSIIPFQTSTNNAD